MSQDAALAWMIGNIGELGLVNKPNWVHVGLVLSDPIRGQITTPVQRDGTTSLRPMVFECADRVELLGLTSGRIELFGLWLDLSQTAPRRALWTFPLDEAEGGGVLVVEPWRRYVFLDDCPLRGQIDWRPEAEEKESASIQGCEFDEGRASDAAYTQIRSALAALLRMKAGEFRRTSKGPTRYENSEEYAAAIHSEIYDKPDRARYLSRASTAVVAGWLGIGEATVDRYRLTFGIGIRDIRRKRVRKPVD
jgi:hypothetical protein